MIHIKSQDDKAYIIQFVLISERVKFYKDKSK